MASVKVLVFGDICGQFEAFSKKVAALSDKVGSFDLVLCVGDFFGYDEQQNSLLLVGNFKFAVPVYVIGASKPEHVQYFSEAGDLCENCYYLGAKGLLTTVSGLSIAYLSGMESTSSDAQAWEFNMDTLQELVVPIAASSDFVGVDVLISSCWPRDVFRFDNSKPNMDNLNENCSGILSKAVAFLKPRYHFAGLNDCFYERQPYRNHRVLAESARQVTRFVGLAKFNSTRKQKFMYAFNVTPISQLPRAKLFEQPQDSTEFPYGAVIRSLNEAQLKLNAVKATGGGKHAKDGSGDAQFFFDLASAGSEEQRGGRGSQRGRGGKRYFDQGDLGGKRQKSVLPPAACWFCLASPEVEKHLVVSIGGSSYMALPKGGLVSDHVMIMPIEHIQSMVAAPSSVREEIQQYKTAIVSMFTKQNKTVVFFERNYKTQHLQVQCVPLPSKIPATAVKDAFMMAADATGIELSEVPSNMDLQQLVNEGLPYFYVEMATLKLFCHINKNFPLQFARQVLASSPVLNCPDREDWRECKLSKQEETNLAQKFREQFAAFDFSLADDDDD